MYSILRRRPSPALVISLIALFCSLGGVSYGLATGSIGSREIRDNEIRSRDIRNNEIASSDIRNNAVRGDDIRNNEVRGRDIRNSTIRTGDVALNTLTGADIRESTLGKVPEAAKADSATSATDAGTVGGLNVKRFFAKQPPGAAAVEILRGDGFIVEAGCTAGGNSVLRLNGLAGAAATNVSLEGNGNASAFYTNDQGLTPGENLPMLGGNASAAGTAVISTTEGRLVTIVYGAESAPSFAGENVCAARGTMISG